MFIQEHILDLPQKDVKELSDDAKEYEFKVFMGPDGIDGPCLGKMRVTENSADEAYSVMLDIIGCRLAEAFPELDIPYSIELVEEARMHNYAKRVYYQKWKADSAHSE